MKNDKCTEKVNLLFEQAGDRLETRKNSTWWVYAAFTDHLLLDVWKPDCQAQKDIIEKAELLLELRVFCEDAEYRLIRGNIGGDLKFRVKDADDDLTKDVDYYDEKQYLDVDTNKSKQELNHWEAKTTGGGDYTIPLPEIGNAGIWIRNYLSYYGKTGQAYVDDWRLLRLGGIK